jgi:AICAR transformylase/IMP cyclohydrolase PurH
MKIKERRRRAFRRKRNLIAQSLSETIFAPKVKENAKKELKRIKKHEVLALKEEYD